MHEEHLRQKEQELHAREIDLLERELHFMISQQTPTPNKRKGIYDNSICYVSYIYYSTGKFKRSRLKLLKKEPGSNISYPIDFKHTITVQHTLDPKTYSGVISPHSPPGSPAIMLRAIARK